MNRLGERFCVCLKFVEFVAEFFDAVVFVYLYPLPLVERHALLPILVVYPNAPVAVDDAMERDIVFALIPRLAQNTGDTLRRHASTARGARNCAVGADASRRDRQS